MKFVALVLSLAVGSHAASMQADAPLDPAEEKLAPLGAASDHYLPKVKDILAKSIASLDDSHPMKTYSTQRNNNVFEWITAVREKVKPFLVMAIRGHMDLKKITDADQEIQQSKTDYNELRSTLRKDSVLNEYLNKTVKEVSPTLMGTFEATWNASNEKATGIYKRGKEITTGYFEKLSAVVDPYIEEFKLNENQAIQIRFPTDSQMEGIRNKFYDIGPTIMVKSQDIFMDVNTAIFAQ